MSQRQLLIPEATTLIHQDLSHSMWCPVWLHSGPDTPFRLAHHLNTSGIPYIIPLVKEIRTTLLFPQVAILALPRDDNNDVFGRTLTRAIQSDCIAAVRHPQTAQEERVWRQDAAYLLHHHFLQRDGILKYKPYYRMDTQDPCHKYLRIINHPAAGKLVTPLIRSRTTILQWWLYPKTRPSQIPVEGYIDFAGEDAYYGQPFPTACLEPAFDLSRYSVPDTDQEVEEDPDEEVEVH